MLHIHTSQIAESDILDLIFKINTPRKSSSDWVSILEGMKNVLNADVAVCAERHCDLCCEWKLHQAGCNGDSLQQQFRALYRTESLDGFPPGEIYPFAEIIDTRHPLFKSLVLPLKPQAGIRVDCTVNEQAVARFFFGRTENIAFSTHEADLLNTLNNHLSQTLHSDQHFMPGGCNEDWIGPFFESFPIATMLVDRNLRVIFQSREAGRIIDNSLVLTVNRQRELKSANPEYWSRFAKAVKTILGDLEQGVPRESEFMSLDRYQILLRPIRINPRSVFIALFILDGEAKLEPNMDVLKKLFQFTGAEARVAVLLAQGLSVNDAKDTLKISRHTARNHLRSMFFKCGVTRQANLIRKIVTSAAMFR